jgi:predicted DNA-binding transcriptional regulator YafY
MEPETVPFGWKIVYTLRKKMRAARVMNRTDRLLAIVLELQARGKLRAEDLAARFETSKRTIYRDMLALGEAGVPLVSIPGQGYMLMEGYFLPPLSFSSEEATMLLLGSSVMAQSFDAQYRQAAQSARRKIEAVLPERLRSEVQRLQNAFHFITAGPAEESPEARKLQQLRRAIIEHHTVRFVYHARHSDEQQPQMREADPLSLAYVNQNWHLSAYCHLRQAVRTFRLERMEALEVLPQTFTQPAESSPAWCRCGPVGTTTVRVLFANEVARWVREARSYYLVSEEERPDGLLVTLQVRQESEILQWLLSWGRHVRVLEPESLRTLLAREARAMLAHCEQLA